MATAVKKLGHRPVYLVKLFVKSYFENYFFPQKPYTPLHFGPFLHTEGTILNTNQKTFFSSTFLKTSTNFPLFPPQDFLSFLMFFLDAKKFLDASHQIMTKITYFNQYNQIWTHHQKFSPRILHCYHFQF